MLLWLQKLKEINARTRDRKYLLKRWTQQMGTLLKGLRAEYNRKPIGDMKYIK